LSQHAYWLFDHPSVLPRALSQTAKQLRCEADYSHPYNPKVKNIWSYTSTHPHKRSWSGASLTAGATLPLTVKPLRTVLQQNYFNYNSDHDCSGDCRLFMDCKKAYVSGENYFTTFPMYMVYPQNKTNLTNQTILKQNLQ